MAETNLFNVDLEGIATDEAPSNEELIADANDFVLSVPTSDPMKSANALNVAGLTQSLGGMTEDQQTLMALDVESKGDLGIANQLVGDFNKAKQAEEDGKAYDEINKALTTGDISLVPSFKETVSSYMSTPEAAYAAQSTEVDKGREVGKLQYKEQLLLNIAEKKATGQDTSQDEYSLHFLLNPEQADKPVTTALYDPIDFVTDLLTGGLVSVARAGGKVTSKVVGKAAITDAGWGMVSGGFMTVADLATEKPLVTALSGIVGPVGAAAIFTSSRRGLAAFLSKTSQHNKELHDQFIQVAKQYDTKMGRAILDANEWKEVPDAVETATAPFVASARNAMLLEDEGIQKNASVLLQSARSAVEEREDMSAIAKRAVDAGESIEVLGLWKKDSPMMPSDYRSRVARELHNKDVANMAAAPRVLFDSLTKRQEATINHLNKINAYAGKVDIGHTDSAWDSKETSGLFKRTFASPSVALKSKAMDLVGDATFFDLQAKRLERGFQKGLKEAQKGLHVGEKMYLARFMDELNQSGIKPVSTDGGFILEQGFFPMSDWVKDAYYSTRIVMDEVHRLSNVAAIGQLKRMGRKWDIDANAPVKVMTNKEYGTRGTDGVEWTLNIKQQGGVWTENVNTGEGRVILPNKVNTSLRDLDLTVDKVISYEADYIPRVYKDDWRVMKISLSDDGNIKSVDPVATAPTFKESRNTISQLRAEGKNEAVQFVSLRKGDNVMQAGVEQGAFDELANLTPNQLRAIKKDLVKHGMPTTQIENLLDSIRTFSYKRNSHMLERGRALKGADLTSVAPLEPSDSAIAQYLSTMSKNIAKGEYAASLRDKFLNTYGNMLSERHDWSSTIKSADKGIAFDPAVVEEAKIVQAQIRTALDMPTASELAHRAKMDNRADRWRQKNNPIYHKMADMLDATPTPEGIAAGLKGVAAITKLNLFNVSQAIVQSTGVLNSVGKLAVRPEELSGVVSDATALLNPLSKRGKHLNKVLEESGFMTTANYANLKDTANLINGNLSIMGKVGNASSVFYRAGEGLNRMVAFLGERRNLIRAIEAGEHKLRKSDIDRPEFIRELVQNASSTALNMSKVNQPRYARGMSGVPFQFMQFATHQFELMNPVAKNMSKREKLGVWSAWMGAFGAGGVPFLYDVGMLGEAAAEWSGNPEYIGATDKMLEDIFGKYKKGLSSNDFFDISNRAGVAFAMQNYYDGFDAENLLGASGQTLIKMINGNVNTMSDLYDVFTNQQEFSPDMVAQGFSEIPGLINPYLAARAVSTGQLRDKRQKLLKEKPDLKDIISTGVGLKTKELADAQAVSSITFRVNRAIERWAKDKAREIAQTAITNPEFSTKLLNDAIEQMVEVNPRAINKLTRNLPWEMQRVLIPEGQRSMFDRIRNDFHLPDEYKHEEE